MFESERALMYIALTGQRLMHHGKYYTQVWSHAVVPIMHTLRYFC